MKLRIKEGCVAGIVPLAALGFLICALVKPKTPKVYVDQFTMFALRNKNYSNNIIHYDLRLRNTNNIDPGIYYDALSLTFYYQPNSKSNNIISSFPVEIGNATFTPFYQHKFTYTNRGGNIDTKGVKWENVTAPITFKVELATAVRFDKTFWKSKRRHIAVEAELKTNDHGNMVKEGIKLRSQARRNNKSRYELVCMIIAILAFMHF